MATSTTSENHKQTSKDIYSVQSDSWTTAQLLAEQKKTRISTNVELITHRYEPRTRPHIHIHAQQAATIQLHLCCGCLTMYTSTCVTYTQRCCYLCADNGLLAPRKAFISISVFTERPRTVPTLNLRLFSVVGRWLGVWISLTFLLCCEAVQLVRSIVCLFVCLLVSLFAGLCFNLRKIANCCWHANLWLICFAFCTTHVCLCVCVCACVEAAYYTSTLFSRLIHLNRSVSASSP